MGARKRLKADQIKEKKALLLLLILMTARFQREKCVWWLIS